MGRPRLLGAELPFGLYQTGRQFRARASSKHAWVYFGRDKDAAITQHAAWLAQGMVYIHWPKAAADLLRTIRKNARPRNILVELTQDDVETLLKRSNGRCELTGIRFSDFKAPGTRMRPWYPSIDRLDSRGPYSLTNCRAVCAYANLALNEFGDQAFIGLARGAIRRSKAKKYTVSLVYP